MVFLFSKLKACVSLLLIISILMPTPVSAMDVGEESAAYIRFRRPAPDGEGRGGEDPAAVFSQTAAQDVHNEGEDAQDVNDGTNEDPMAIFRHPPKDNKGEDLREMPRQAASFNLLGPCNSCCDTRVIYSCYYCCLTDQPSAAPHTLLPTGEPTSRIPTIGTTQIQTTIVSTGANSTNFNATNGTDTTNTNTNTTGAPFVSPAPQSEAPGSEPAVQPSQAGGVPTQAGGQPTQEGGVPTQAGGQPTQAGGQPTAAQVQPTTSSTVVVTNSPGAPGSEPAVQPSQAQPTTSSTVASTGAPVQTGAPAAEPAVQPSQAQPTTSSTVASTGAPVQTGAPAAGPAVQPSQAQPTTSSTVGSTGAPVQTGAPAAEPAVQPSQEGGQPTTSSTVGSTGAPVQTGAPAAEPAVQPSQEGGQPTQEGTPPENTDSPEANTDAPQTKGPSTSAPRTNVPRTNVPLAPPPAALPTSLSTASSTSQNTPPGGTAESTPPGGTSQNTPPGGTSASTDTPTNALVTTRIPSRTPFTYSPSSFYEEANSLGTAMVAGMSVGGVIGLIILVFVLWKIVKSSCCHQKGPKKRCLKKKDVAMVAAAAAPATDLETGVPSLQTATSTEASQSSQEEEGDGEQSVVSRSSLSMSTAVPEGLTAQGLHALEQYKRLQRQVSSGTVTSLEQLQLDPSASAWYEDGQDPAAAASNDTPAGPSGHTSDADDIPNLTNAPEPSAWYGSSAYEEVIVDSEPSVVKPPQSRSTLALSQVPQLQEALSDIPPPPPLQESSPSIAATDVPPPPQLLAPRPPAASAAVPVPPKGAMPPASPPRGPMPPLLPQRPVPPPILAPGSIVDTL